MSNWKFSGPERPNDVVLIAVKDVLHALHGVEGPLVAVIPIVAPHAGDVSGESWKRRPYKSMGIGSDNLFDHSDVVLINVVGA